MISDIKLQVEAIRCGTVIDHIPARVGMKLLSLFKLTITDERITIGLNLPSQKQIKKDIIKIENIYLTEDQANQLAIYASNATVNIIYNYNVASKLTLVLPKYIDNVLICLNINCISHNEPIRSKFYVKNHNKLVYLQCKFCETEFEHESLIQDM